MNRRNLLSAASAALVGGAALAGSAAAGAQSATRSPRTFVLVHGAWHGGWCWREVADALRGAGHTVYTPTQTGLAHLHRLRRAIYTPLAKTRAWVKEQAWPMRKIASGHDAMIAAPGELSAMLTKLAG